MVALSEDVWKKFEPSHEDLNPLPAKTDVSKIYERPKRRNIKHYLTAASHDAKSTLLRVQKFNYEPKGVIQPKILRIPEAYEGLSLT